MVQIAIIAAAVLTGLFLYCKRPVAYAPFTMWVWVLSPLVRRLVDWVLGWHDPNLILAAPHLVTAIAGLDLFASRRKNPSPVPVAFKLCGAAVVYGFVIGMILQPSTEVLYGLLNWVTPLLFGAYLARHADRYEQNSTALLKCMVWIAGVMGVYGVFQFFVAPAWDAYWLENVTSGLIDPSFGQPEPMLMRVWSTLNSPGVFSGVMAASLLFSTIASFSLTRVPFAIAGYLSFLLCEVRAAWLGWAVGLVFVLRRSQPKVLIRVVVSMAVLIALIVPIVQSSQEIAPSITKRLGTLTDVKSDYSFQERQDMYRIVSGIILHDPFGLGLKNQETVQNLAVDSGILSTLLSVGWLGTLLYLSGVVLALIKPRAVKGDIFLHTCRAICFADLAQYVGGNVFINVGGVVFWMCAGLTVAGFQWHRGQMPAPSRAERNEEVETYAVA